MNQLIKYLKEVKNAIYAHVGFKEDYVYYTLEDMTGFLWVNTKHEILYAKEKGHFKTGDYYSAEIYKQRFYKKWIYKGDDLTMVFANPGVDGMKYFFLLDNKKEIELEEIEDILYD